MISTGKNRKGLAPESSAARQRRARWTFEGCRLEVGVPWGRNFCEHVFSEQKPEEVVGKQKSAGR